MDTIVPSTHSAMVHERKNRPRSLTSEGNTSTYISDTYPNNKMPTTNNAGASPTHHITKFHFGFPRLLGSLPNNILSKYFSIFFFFIFFFYYFFFFLVFVSLLNENL